MSISNPIEMYHFLKPLYKAKTGECDTVNIEINFNGDLVRLHKTDVIALAKHFELTESDLNKQGK